MSRESGIQIEGRVIEALSSVLYRVELKNGHRILARVSGKLRLSFVQVSAGDDVVLEVSPYDLSRGCILTRKSV